MSICVRSRIQTSSVSLKDVLRHLYLIQCPPDLADDDCPEAFKRDDKTCDCFKCILAWGIRIGVLPVEQ
jgi:hypothetical protein